MLKEVLFMGVRQVSRLQPSQTMATTAPLM